MPVNICKTGFGSTLQLAVEVAWGADPRSSSAGWTWTDITTDVLATDSNEISIARGQADEGSQAQPAECRMTLKNISGKYSQGVSSSNYPNVKRNVPIRIRLILSSVSYTRFWGYVTSWTPKWSTNGDYAVTELVAHGALKRLAEGKKVLQSAVLRGTLAEVTPSEIIAYWPCEEEEGATSFRSALPRTYNDLYDPLSLSITGTVKPNFGAYGGFACSKPLSTGNGSRWGAMLPRYTAKSPSEIRINFLINIPSGGATNGAEIMRFYTSSDTSNLWILRYYDSWNTRLEAKDTDGTTYDLGTQLNYRTGYGNTAVSLKLIQSSSNVQYVQGVYDIDSMSGSTFSEILGPCTLGKITRIVFYPGGDDMGSMAIGHVSVQKEEGQTFPTPFGDYWKAHSGETVNTRLNRLATENSEPITIVGTSDMLLGAQVVKTFVDTLQDCANSEAGVLADGMNQGPTYYCRQSHESLDAAMALSATSADLASFEPVDDDALFCNHFTASLSGNRGSAAPVQKATGRFSVADIGPYEKTGEYNAQNEGDLAHFASWQVYKGTKFGPSNANSYRYPKIPIRLSRRASLATTVLNFDIMKRIDVTNVSQVATQQEPYTISVQALGYEESISMTLWDIAYNCVPYTSKVGKLAATTGDAGTYLARFTSDGSTLATGAASGATSLSVSTPSGPLWTTAADDFPFTINIADIPITVTNITGSSTPQTFSVTGSTVTKALSSGASVTLWDPAVLGL